MSNTEFFSKTQPDNHIRQETIVLPVIEESISIGKKIVETGNIKITKQVEEKEETIDISLIGEEYDIEHVAINEFANEQLPKVRQEGDTLIIPVVKEVFVKRILLVEEIRITKRTTQKNEQQKISLRSETVTINRTSQTDGSTK